MKQSMVMNYAKWTLALVAWVSATGLSAAQSAEEIVQRAEERLQSGTMYAEIIMEIYRPDWAREVRLKTWAEGSENSLILITGPARDRGTAFLKHNREVWNWQPSIDRVIKMPPSMMTQSWMGSDFTNDDLVQESSETNDYTHKKVGSEVIDGHDCWIIEMVPNEDAPVVWGKVLTFISKQHYVTLRSEFFDEDDYLVNTLTMSDLQEVDGRMVAMHMEMIPSEDEGHRTVLKYKALNFDVALDDDFFTIQNMKRVRP